MVEGIGLVTPIQDWELTCSQVDVLVLAAGFEDRAVGILTRGRFASESYCVLVRFENDTVGNDQVLERFRGVARQKFANGRVVEVVLSASDPGRFESDLGNVIGGLPNSRRVFGLDISGLPSYAICLAMRALRSHRPGERLLVFYTAAQEYNPSRTEYDQMMKGRAGEIEFLPRSMALEMDTNLVLEAFGGYRSQNARSCLAIFAGYEVHRSAGVIDAINPSLLLLMYGRPGDDSLAWRLELSKALHRKFEQGRQTATEIVSTLQVSEAVSVLENYYEYLIDDYDLVISPICSKMHVVATYLFWERFGEAQLTFPVPIGYDPKAGPRGIGVSYSLALAPQRKVFS